MNTAQDPCNFCGATLREQMQGCREISCYRQFLKIDRSISKIDEAIEIVHLAKSFHTFSTEEDENKFKKALTSLEEYKEFLGLIKKKLTGR